MNATTTMERVMNGFNNATPPIVRLVLIAGIACAAASFTGKSCAQGATGGEAPAGGPSFGLSKFVGQVLDGEFSPTPAPPTPAEAVPPGKSHVIPMRTDFDPDAIRVANDGGLVRLMVRDAPLQQVLALLAESQKLNLVFSSVEEVSITVALDRVPLSEALDSILSSCGHTWAQRGDIIHITAVTAESALAPGAQGRRLEMFELDYSAAADIDLAVKGLLSPLGKSWTTQSSPNDNRRTREVIVVEDLPEYVDRVASYIMQADQPPRQVMVEVQILEVRLENELRHGVDLAELGRLGGAAITTIGSTNFAGIAPPEAPQIFTINASAGDLTAIAELIETTTDAKTLASPKLLAVNGQESQLQIGKQLPYRETTNSPSNVSQETVRFLDVGVILKFTPWITRDGRILMNIAPTVSDGALNSNGDPETVKTEVATDVFLNDGQGIVIGGLIQEKDSVKQSQVPVLGNIPYAGALFQRRVVDRERSEIIVALMPHLLPYNCQQQSVSDSEVHRARDPLLYGPLCRYPRPYEPRLPDAVETGRQHCQRKFGSTTCPPPSPADCSHCGQAISIRRLPPCPEATAGQSPKSIPQETADVAMPANQRFLRR